MKILYFSATGNCLYIAKKIGGELLSIPQLQKESIYDIADDAVGIITPVYCFDVPRPVRNYLNKVNITADYIFSIMTYGNLAMAALEQMRTLLESRNAFLNYSNEIKMADNYLPGFEMSKQIKKQNDAKQEMKIDSIKNDIISRKCSLKKHNFIQKYATAVFSKNYIADKGILKASIKLFTVNNDCNGCGTCRKVCPMKNIIGTDKPEYQNHCEFCLACIHLCPKNAIHLKNEKSGMRFINPHIKASEIINANRQI